MGKPTTYEHVLPTLPARPALLYSTTSNNRFKLISGYHLLRDLLPLGVILGLGALIPTLLSPIHSALTPVVVAALLILPYLAIPILTALGFRKNDSIDRAATGATWIKWNEDGVPPEYAVLMIGARCNGPFGFFDPGFSNIGKQFTGMLQDLADDPNSGLLNGENFMSTQRFTNNTLMSVLYFKTVADIHRFSTGALHRHAQKNYHSIGPLNERYSIWHELFEIKEGRSEGYYFNTEPRGLGAIWQKKEDEKEGVEGEVWESVLRKATGKATTSQGRMNGGV